MFIYVIGIVFLCLGIVAAISAIIWFIRGCIDFVAITNDCLKALRERSERQYNSILEMREEIGKLTRKEEKTESEE